MLTGAKLGAAIEAARKLKKVTKRALAKHFKVAPPSVQDWVNRGTIDKEKLPGLWEYFNDVVGPEHWGLVAFPGRDSPPPVAGKQQPPDDEAASADVMAADVVRNLSSLLQGHSGTRRKTLADLLVRFTQDPESDELRAEITLLLKPTALVPKEQAAA